MRSTSQPILSHLPASFRRLRVHRLRGSPPEPVSSEQHSVGLLRRGFLRCAAASLAATHLALRTSVGVPSARLARASRNPSARSSPATIVWPPSPPLRASLSCLVGLTEPFARLGESPNMPSCSLRQVVVLDSGVAAFLEPSHPASFALVRVRRVPLKRIRSTRSRGQREIHRLSGGIRLDLHGQQCCRQRRAQRTGS